MSSNVCHTDVVVIGGGPAGATSATLLAQAGHSVVLLEREKFPRFQIGESLLPYNNDLFRRLGVLDSLSEGPFLPKYGAEFVTADGRTGYKFRFDRNLPRDYSRSFQVSRSKFDELLLRNAGSKGVDVREETAVVDVDLSDPSSAVVTAAGRSGIRIAIRARFVLDATGARSLLASRGGRFEHEGLKKVSFFAHFRAVAPGGEGRDVGNTVIVLLKNAWFWLIPIDHETTSVGLVVDRDEFLRSGLKPEEMLHGTIEATPYVKRRMVAATRVSPVHARKDFSYRAQRLTGENFALVGDAAGFIDPIFSTGVFMAMKSAEVAADAVSEKLQRGSSRLLRSYEKRMTTALKKYMMFIENFYRREFLEVFLQPNERFGLVPAIVGVLAGNVFERTRDRGKLALFFMLVKLQKRRAVIARRIRWDRLPAAART